MIEIEVPLKYLLMSGLPRISVNFSFNIANKQIAALRDDVDDWLFANITGPTYTKISNYADIPFVIVFENENDALMFKMRWL